MISQLFRNMPDVVKNLLIINLLVFGATMLLGFNEWTSRLGMYYPASENFQPYQIVTYMFTHGGLGHIFFNMFALVMFGAALERVWGPKKMLLFYFITGLGALAMHVGVQAIEVYNILGNVSGENLDLEIVGNSIRSANFSGSQEEFSKLAGIFYTPTVGASGAIYGLLIAFAILFPNTELMLIFLPIPIKAKYFIPIMMALELFMGVNQFEFDNIAHFAHLGGALFGFILVKIWQKDRSNFY